MSLVARASSIFRSIAIVIAIALVFLFGVATTVYLSLRSPEVTVPDIVGKNRFDAEKILGDADLKFRVRATRPSNEAPDTVMFQLPRAGEVVKAGQTVAMDISRPTKAGESSETVTPDEDTTTNRNVNANTNANENKPKRPPHNKNANDNANGNANANSNGNTNRIANTNRNANSNANTNRNANANTNRPNANTNGNVNVPRTNVNRTSTGNVNLRPVTNDNRRPVARPTPVPNPTRTRPAP